MAAPTAPRRDDDRVSLLDLVERSLQLGSHTFGPRPVPVEIVERVADATAEAYVTGIGCVADATRVQLLLDFGVPATATLPSFEAEWLELAEGQIVPVRVDPWKNSR
jgi:hypothetical protein